MVAEVPGIATWKTLAVDLHKGWRAKLSVGAVRDEALVPFLQIVESSHEHLAAELPGSYLRRILYWLLGTSHPLL